jgi:hypothetical protein
MSDQALEAAAPAVSGPGLDLVALSLAAGNPVRWQVLLLMATEGHGMRSLAEAQWAWRFPLGLQVHKHRQPTQCKRD